jgi:hypothetical protein
MDDGDTEPGLLVQVRDVQPGSADFEQVLALAARVLAQDRYLVSSVPSVQESRVSAPSRAPGVPGSCAT